MPAPTLPPSFDGPADTHARDRLRAHVPGAPARQRPGAGRRRLVPRPDGAVRAPGRGRTAGSRTCPGLGRVRLAEPLGGRARVGLADAIVVMAHRDNTGIGPGANDDASGTAALIELARSYAQTSAGQPGAPASERVRPVHTLVFLSTDGGSFGGLGAERFVAAPAVPRRRDRQPRCDRRTRPAASRDHRRHAALAGGHPRRDGRQARARADRVRARGGRASPASCSTSRSRSRSTSRARSSREAIPAADADHRRRAAAGRVHRPARRRSTARRLAALGRAAQQLLGSLDQGLELTQGTTSFVWAGARVVRGWAIELLLAALLIPFFVGVVDLVRALPATADPRSGPRSRRAPQPARLLALRRPRVLRLPRDRRVAGRPRRGRRIPPPPRPATGRCWR